MHFNDETWSDFARGVAAEEVRQEIAAHLEQQCAECAAQAQIWQSLAQTARQEQGFNPPTDIVRLVKQEFELAQTPRQTLLAGLMFDSFAQPVAAGIRAAGVTARQVLYEAGGIAVDLRLESFPGSQQVSAVGQVQDRSSRAFLRPNLPVALLGPAGDELKRIRTNDFGEFHFEFARDRVARIAIEIDASRIIQIPLADLQGYWQSS